MQRSRICDDANIRWKKSCKFVVYISHVSLLENHDLQCCIEKRDILQNENIQCMFIVVQRLGKI